ncbi:hypothetical protein F8388_019826 [Cannabis sativa]|uniref:Reticulon-like protein n=1 Tax=Cannabis sativa TaxID=3483 RepID=A0A7J6HPM3_CANSA|nr:hypothetical protein F8388_019826 [Cannabis sativa]
MSDSDNEISNWGRLFGRERPIHQVLGGGKVADVLLWKERNISAALLVGMTVIWFLFEVVEYNFVTLLCHIFITTMLVFYIWSTCAAHFHWTRPQIPKVVLDDSAFGKAASTFHKRFNESLPKFLEIACGNDLPLFFLIESLKGFVCMGTLPFLYDRYEDEVDRFAVRLIREIKRTYRKLDSNFLNKIPRGPVNEKKYR